jgi:two-component system, chemotaxis family, response regulator PixG
MNTFGTFTKLSPLSLLRHLANCYDSTCVRINCNSVSWLIYLEQGKIIYGTHSIEPFDRLERHLRRLSQQIPDLSSETRVQLRLMFETEAASLPNWHHQNDENQAIIPEQPPEYQAICWLVSQKHLNPTQAALLIQELVKEVLEELLLIKTGNYTLIDINNKIPVICRIDTEIIIGGCQERLQIWQSLAPYISSPYQRPYVRVKSAKNQDSFPNLQQDLTTWMKGFSLRHLAVITNQDELQMSRNLHSHIVKGEIVLHEPDPPFDKLPKVFEGVAGNQYYMAEYANTQLPDSTLLSQLKASQGSSEAVTQPLSIVQRLSQATSQQEETVREVPTSVPTASTATSRKAYKIVSVDDSPTVLREISRFLEQENCSVVAINDPVKAVMSIIRNKPDLILLDLNMDGIDGYELCRIIRNNSMFKKTPIIMVTGNKGLVDKVKARLVGASGYLTKPFSQADLLKIVFMHLT